MPTETANTTQAIPQRDNFVNVCSYTNIMLFTNVRTIDGNQTCTIYETTLKKQSEVTTYNLCAVTIIIWLQLLMSNNYGQGGKI